MIFAFKVIFFLPSGGSPLNKCELHNWRNLLANGFLQSPFEANEVFCLPNRFGLFTNHKQPLKCVWQNNYLDLWSNTLYIIWQGVHLLVKLLEELINKLLKRRNLSQAFLIHFTLYLYLWWRVSRPICIFWKVSSLDENSLGMIVLMSFLWKYK